MREPPDKLFKKAARKHESGDLAAARTLYKRILKKHPDHIDSLYMYGTLCAEQNDLKTARTYLLRAAELAPLSPLIHNNLGNVYLKSGQYGLAADCYRQTLTLDPKMVQANYNLGQAAIRLGQLPEAAAALENALALQPGLVQAQLSLARVYMDLGQYPKAIRLLRQVLAAQPDNAHALHALGSAHAARGGNEEAIACYDRLLELNPDDGSAKHARATLRGETPARAPRQHVAGIFDGLSGRFDQHLRQLGYQVPQWIHDALLELTGAEHKFSRMLDLGCGTGMAGALFRDNVTRLEGVDLSPGMIEQAKAKGVYDRLYVADLLDHLKQAPGPYDLLVATDVFTYLGDLRPIFSAVAGASAPGAWFLFSIEECEGEDYRLLPTGRYAQSAAYIASLAEAHGYRIELERAVVIRKEQVKEIPGRIYLLRFSQA